MQEHAKIAMGMERLSTVFRAALWEEAKQSGLSPLQAQILLFIASHAQPLNRISHLAKEFAITKATVSDAVRVLLEKKLLKKQAGDDARACSLHLTARGRKHTQKLSVFTRCFDEVLTDIPAEEAKKIWEGLLLLIGHLQATAMIPLRMCLNCEHYRKHNGAAYCHLLQQPLQLNDLRLDCPEHRALAA